MEDTLKGLLVSITMISIFALAVLSFITAFSTEQGFILTNGQDNQAFLTMQNESNFQNLISNLTSIQNDSEKAFNQWDVTVGFMGSNTVKQTAGTGISNYIKNIFNTLIVIATELFGKNSPIVYVLSALALLSLGYFIYAVIQFVRTGR